jgi:hypothetical protein
MYSSQYINTQWLVGTFIFSTFYPLTYTKNETLHTSYISVSVYYTYTTHLLVCFICPFMSYFVTTPSSPSVSCLNVDLEANLLLTPVNGQTYSKTWNLFVDILDVLYIVYFTTLMASRVLALSTTSFQQQQEQCHSSHMWVLLLVLLVEDVYCAVKRYRHNCSYLSSHALECAILHASSFLSTTVIVPFSLIRFTAHVNPCESFVMFAMVGWGCYELFGVHCIHELNGTFLFALFLFETYSILVATGIGVVWGCVAACVQESSE